jgi:hypothetical protein
MILRYPLCDRHISLNLAFIYLKRGVRSERGRNPLSSFSPIFREKTCGAFKRGGQPLFYFFPLSFQGEGARG